MNNVTLIGRLAKDPELKYGQSGKAYVKFTLAVKRVYSKDEVDFINCVAFGKTAELIAEHLNKSSRLGVIGSLQMSRYEVNGEKRINYEVMVQHIEFLESKKEAIEEFDEDEYFDEIPL